jgi:hypothetical protein
VPIINIKNLKNAEKAQEEAADTRQCWSELTESEKDDILHKMALQLGFIKQDKQQNHES